MSNGFIVNPTSISFAAIRADLETYITTLPDSEKWVGFFDSSVGQHVIELIAGTAAFFAYMNIAGRREAYLQYAENLSSLVGGSESLGYSVSRGRCKHLRLTVVPSVTQVLPRFSSVGSVKDQDLVLLEDTPVQAGVTVDLVVALGQYNVEDLTIQTANRTVFRFLSQAVSDDYRLLLNGTEVPVSTRIIDLTADSFVALSNVFGAVDVFSLNRSTAPVQYIVGDALQLQFVTLKNVTFLATDVLFDYGALSSYSIEAAYQAPESKEQIRVNAPVYHETQRVVRGREDYSKVFLGLSTDLNDTNQHDVSAAVVELSYVRKDMMILTATQKAAFVAQLIANRTMGVPPPQIGDPTGARLRLAIRLKLSAQNGNPTVDVETILSGYEKVLGQSLDLSELENELEALAYVQTARIVIDSVLWASFANYQRGEHVRALADNGKVYEMARVLYRTDAIEPTWPVVDGAVVIDGDIAWTCAPVSLVVPLYTWTASTKKIVGDYVVPVVPNGKMYVASEFVRRSYGNDEVQKIQFSAIPTSGTWRIYYGTEKTTDLPFSADAAAVQAALRALDSLSDVVVTGNYSTGFVVQFVGADGNKSQPQLMVSDPGTNEVQNIAFSSVPDAGSWGLSFGAETTTPIAYNAVSNAVKSALEALTGIDTVNVTGDYTNGFQVEFTGVNALSDVAMMVLANLSDAGQNAKQLITFSSVPSTGTWRLHYGTEYTQDIPYNAPAIQIQSELNNLSSLSGCAVSGSYAAGFEVHFTTADGTKPQPLIVTTNPGRNEIQKILLSTVPDQGTWTLKLGVETTSSLAHNATAAQIKAALEALTAVTSVSVTGDYSSGLVVEFTGATDGLKPWSMLEAPANTLKRLGSTITTTMQRVTGGLIPAQSLDTGITVACAETQEGRSPVSSISKAGVATVVTITEATKGEVPASNLKISGNPVAITPTTLIDATAVEPTWPTTIGDRVVDGDIIWAAIALNDTPDVWEPYTQYRLGDYVAPIAEVVDGDDIPLMYQCVGFVGCTGTVEPTWPTVVGNAIEDGDIEWICRDPEASPAALAWSEFFEITQVVTTT